LEVVRTIGFAGLGLMGEAMATNLAKDHPGLLVWNRSKAKVAAPVAAGATAAASLDELFTRASVVFLMLANEAAMNAVLDRHGPEFDRRMREHTIVHMGTTSPAFSKQLETDIRASGGSYVEAPVSGSRVPAENGALAAMLAGEPEGVNEVGPLLRSMCSMTAQCGAVPNALLTKLAVNLYLITSVTGLAEASHFASRLGLDFSNVLDVINGGPLGSDVTRVKGAKLCSRDFAPQATIKDVLMNAELVAEAARGGGIAAPLISQCCSLFRSAVASGEGGSDMAAVVMEIERLSVRPCAACRSKGAAR
jgi:3-hydroxyisobutyrate dehydrogenase